MKDVIIKLASPVGLLLRFEGEEGAVEEDEACEGQVVGTSQSVSLRS